MCLAGQEAVTMCTQARVLLTHTDTSVHLSCTHTLRTPGSGPQPGDWMLQASSHHSPGDHSSGSWPRGAASSAWPVSLTSWLGAQVPQVEGP